MATKPNDDNSLSHTRWNCKYHIVFIPKYRRKEIYGKLRRDIGLIIRQLCEYKNVEIVEAHAMKDHIHMMVRIRESLQGISHSEICGCQPLFDDPSGSSKGRSPYRGA